MFRVDHEVRDTKDKEVAERRLRSRPYQAPCLHVYGAMTSLTCNGLKSVPEDCSDVVTPGEGCLVNLCPGSGPTEGCS